MRLDYRFTDLLITCVVIVSQEKYRLSHQVPPQIRIRDTHRISFTATIPSISLTVHVLAW
jgi:hypothetical protein